MFATALDSESDEYSAHPPIYDYIFQVTTFLQISHQNSVRLSFPLYV